MTRALLRRGVRFSVVGLLCSAISFGVFLALSRATHYEVANAGAWASGMGVSFVCNRVLTYGVRTRRRLPQQTALFIAGSLGQLLVSSLGYWILIGLLHLPAWAAYPICLVFTSAYMFAYMEAVVFRGDTIELG